MTDLDRELFDKAPIAIAVTDETHKIVYLNQQFTAVTGLPLQDWLNRYHVELPIEAVDKKGQRVKLFGESEAYFQYWQIPLKNNQLAHYYVPERPGQDGRHQAGAAKNPKRASWLEFLDYEVSRSRRYDNPLSLLKLKLIELDNAETNPELMQICKDTLMSELRWADMIGQTAADTFIMVLPETPLTALQTLKEKIRTAFANNLRHRGLEANYRLVFGQAQWQQKEDAALLLGRARDDLKRNLEALLAEN